MHWPDEIVPSTEVRKPLAALGKKEVEMAKHLITSMAEPWNPEAFKDQYTGQLLKIIDQKVKAGGKLAPAKPQPKSAGVVDLMAALEQSLKSAGRKKPAKVTALKTKQRKAG